MAVATGQAGPPRLGRPPGDNMWSRSPEVRSQPPSDAPPGTPSNLSDENKKAAATAVGPGELLPEPMPAEPKPARPLPGPTPAATPNRSPNALPDGLLPLKGPKPNRGAADESDDRPGVQAGAPS